MPGRALSSVLPPTHHTASHIFSCLSLSRILFLPTAGGDEVVPFEEPADNSDFEESFFDSFDAGDWDDAEECPYEAAFEENGYADREAVLTLEEEDLDFLEVTDPEHRARILEGIEQLKHQYDRKHVLDASDMTEAEALAAALDELEPEDKDPHVAHAPPGVPRPTSLPSLVPVQPVKMSPYVGIPAVKVSELLGRNAQLDALKEAAVDEAAAAEEEDEEEKVGGKHKWLERRKRGVLLAVHLKPKEPPAPEDDSLVMRIETHQRGWVDRKASMAHWAERLSPRPGHDDELLVAEVPLVPLLALEAGEGRGEGNASEGGEGGVAGLDQLALGKSSGASVAAPEHRPESSPTSAELAEASAAEEENAAALDAMAMV